MLRGKSFGLNQVSNSAFQLSDFTKPGRFDDVVNAVKKVLQNSHFDQGVQNVAPPSLSLKIGHSLKKCINILRTTPCEERIRAWKKMWTILETYCRKVELPRFASFR